MHSFLADRSKFLSAANIALIAILTLLLSGWTCSAMFVSCQGVGSQPQVTALSPDNIQRAAESVVLTVEGRSFTRQSQIMWNSNPLQTTFMDRHHLQTTISQQIFESFGGSAGSTVQLSVFSKGSADDSGCPINGNSDTQTLVIN